MTEKRFYLDENGINDREYEFSVLGEDELVNIINELAEENQQLKKELEDCRNIKLFSRRELERENKELKEEIQLLKDGMEAYENAIPYVCTCEQVRDIHSEMFDFNMKQNKFYKEHPNRCTVIIDGVRYE